MAVLFEAVLKPGSKLIAVVYKDRDVRRNVRLGIDESTVVAVLIVKVGGRSFFVVGNRGLVSGFFADLRGQ
jgi:hypothetical protein